MRISSPTNPLVRRLRRLAESPRACRDQMRTIAEGLHVVEAALAAGVEIATVVTRAGAADAAHELAERADGAQGNVKRIELSAELYDAIAPVERGVGVLAEIVVPPSAPFRTLSGDAVYLDAVQDPGNVGALLRTAAAAGVGTVIAGAGSAYIWSPRVVRAAMGAHFRLGLYDDVSIARAIRGFRGETLAADLDGEDLFAAHWGDGPALWMFGSEGRGLSELARRSATRRLRIPIAAGIESLNVAAAAAVCLFEQLRRRSRMPAQVSTTAARAGSPA